MIYQYNEGHTQRTITFTTVTHKWLEHSSHLWVCCAQSQRGKGSRGRAWERWVPRTLAGSPHSSSRWAGASSWTPVRVCPAARSPCSTGRCLVWRVGIKGNTQYPVCHSVHSGCIMKQDNSYYFLNLLVKGWTNDDGGCETQSDDET